MRPNYLITAQNCPCCTVAIGLNLLEPPISFSGKIGGKKANGRQSTAFFGNFNDNATSFWDGMAINCGWVLASETPSR